VKKAKMVPDEVAVPENFKRVHYARFPDDILALPNVIETIDMFLVDNTEALVLAERMGNREWMTALQERCGWTDEFVGQIIAFNQPYM
jgi:hypothetical protein